MSVKWYIYLLSISLLTGTCSELFCRPAGSRFLSVSSIHDKHSPDDTASDNDTINIPDPNFLDALIWWGVDKNDDSVISSREAEAAIMLYVSDRDISDMSGIEAFINLESLYCANNQLTGLDVSACSSLTFLDCGLNQLTELDLSSNSDLTTLYCGWSELTYLDVSNSEYLVFLDCGCNQFTSLDVSGNPLLHALYCGWNQLTNLDLTTNPALTFLDCTSNQINHLDISASPLLNTLYCGWNQLDILDLGNNTALNELYCSSNSLYNLDISKNTALDTLELQYMSGLYKVCVWTLPFPPPGLGLRMDESPNIYFATECGDMLAPELEIPENHLYRPEFISAISSEDGMIYLVPEHTNRNLGEICSHCQDSVPAVAGEITLLPLGNVSNGVYWIYARDLSNNLSVHGEVIISGVGMNIHELGSIKVYPIPAGDLLYIEAGMPGMYIIEIISSNGRSVYKDHINGSIHRVDISSFREGLYVIRLQSQDISLFRKIVVRPE